MNNYLFGKVVSGDFIERIWRPFYLSMKHRHLYFHNTCVPLFQLHKKFKYPFVQKWVTFWVPLKLQTLDDVTLCTNICPRFNFFEVCLHCDIFEVHNWGKCLDVCIVSASCIEKLQISTTGGEGLVIWQSHYIWNCIILCAGVIVTLQQDTKLYTTRLYCTRLYCSRLYCRVCHFDTFLS